MRVATAAHTLLGLASAWLLPAAALANHNGVPAMYATKAEAEQAAKTFHCTGAHPMGNQWMPCSQHPTTTTTTTTHAH